MARRPGRGAQELKMNLIIRRLKCSPPELEVSEGEIGQQICPPLACALKCPLVRRPYFPAPGGGELEKRSMNRWKTATGGIRRKQVKEEE